MLDAFFRSYVEQYRPFKDYWNYEDGCMLTACQHWYEATGDAFFAQYILDYLSVRVAEDGTIPSYLTQQHCLDSFNCGKALFFAASATDEPRYQRAIRWQAAQLSAHPRTKSGFCWHKAVYPEQIWLDGLYMVLPFLAHYAAWQQETAWYEEIAHWFSLVRQRMRVSETGLYRHGLDEARRQCWADAKTGLSPTFWLRGEGWLLMALVDTISLLPPAQTALATELTAMLQEAVFGLLPYRAPDGLFHQVLACAGLAGNYTETSGSCMVAYACMRGAGMGLLGADVGAIGVEMLQSVCQTKLRQSGARWVLCDICGSAGLGGATERDGSSAYYLSEPTVPNDPKGVSALMLAEAARRRFARGTTERRAVV